MKGITIGSDPEFFLKDRAGNFVSAIGIVKGTKENKIDLPNGHKLFYDNVLAEMNITPASDEDEFIQNISECLSLVSEVVSPYYLVQQASATFPPRQCQHPDAKKFGCNPELCAYDLYLIPPPELPADNTFRSAGGHIHLGAPEGTYPLFAVLDDNPEYKEETRDWGRIWVVRMLDLFVGLPSIMLDNDTTSAARRILYGHAGTHRAQKAYGVEYRATGNFWLASPNMARLIYRLCMYTVEFVAANRHLTLWQDRNNCVAYNISDLRDAINKSDKKLAISLLEEVVKKIVPDSLWNQIFQMSEKRSDNFLKEWRLA